MTLPPTAYAAYIQSPEWRAVRERYWRSRLPKCCYVCSDPRRPGFHLHHRTYKRLGAERLNDIVPVCESCHELIHALVRSGLHHWGATNVAARSVRKGDLRRIPRPVRPLARLAIVRRASHG